MVQVITALLPVTAVARTLLIRGAVQSVTAVVVYWTLAAPLQSRASVYRAVMISPAATDRRPSPFAAGRALRGKLPRKIMESALSSVSMTVSGEGSVVLHTWTVVVCTVPALVFRSRSPTVICNVPSQA